MLTEMAPCTPSYSWKLNLKSWNGPSHFFLKTLSDWFCSRQPFHFCVMIATVPIVYLSDSFFEFLIKIFITYIIFFLNGPSHFSSRLVHLVKFVKSKMVFDKFPLFQKQLLGNNKFNYLTIILTILSLTCGPKLLNMWGPTRGIFTFLNGR